MRLFIRILVGILICIGLLAAFMHNRSTNQRKDEESALATLKKTMTLASGSFPPNGDMPVNCSCKGKEVSPALTWEGGTPQTQSYVVLATDYDVPTPAFSVFNFPHWVLYNLPASVRSLPEGVSPEQMRMLGGKIGKNGTGDLTYVGPCPPVGRHSYVFRIYALDKMLTFPAAPDKQEILGAIQGHILSYGELTGYFQ